MSIAQNLQEVRSRLPEGVELVAVSKFHPAADIVEAYEAGQRHFGESRVQEFVEKADALPGDITWHFIGHLQTNKVKQLVGRASVIESVDSERLLALIDRVSAEKGVRSRVLLQMHVAAEETKFGFSPEELCDYFSHYKYKDLQATELCGIMAMATNTDDEERVKADFAKVAETFRAVRKQHPELREFNTLSIGMSDDFPAAVAAGSTSVRIGTAIFGKRL